VTEDNDELKVELELSATLFPSLSLSFLSKAKYNETISI